MNVVLIIPTGVGAEIGGHAGDGNVIARLLGEVADLLIVHPNVVNAADINEMPVNALYVEGSMLDRLLQGSVGLQMVRANRVLVAVNAPARADTINAVNAARISLGLEAEIIELETPLMMVAEQDPETGQAGGTITGLQELIEQVQDYDFHALAIHTEITVDPRWVRRYLEEGGVNPWGGVEAEVSKLVSLALDVPVAHAPTDSGAFDNYLQEVVDPRQAAELVSITGLHSVLKGLQRAPRVGGTLTYQDIHVMVSPHGCFGAAHAACLEKGIPVIVVKENKTIFNLPTKSRFIEVDNYLEAAGLISAMRAGIDPNMTRVAYRDQVKIRRKG